MTLDSPELLLDHDPSLRGLAGALLQNRADIDDVVQNTYSARQTHRPQHALDRDTVLDRGKKPPPAAAANTSEHLDREHPAQQLR